ncbi:retinol dehydrogenase 12 [Phlebotomus papatasi]|uniref:retinol dehydrogenase 12 n=1 Tax=Phlebotomus papatasi TaxID=29031 RepID=UPI002483CEED|nr:retinol dehydrogenase 12 [Phlebotomus papatasi]XP_055699573.1 retinol dehydrogenase 12 [Phlebotomus papatasi]XP_055699574.1 retinol dehydrogenase 12 [Phlebotomus papatasi]
MIILGVDWSCPVVQTITLLGATGVASVIFLVNLYCYFTCGQCTSKARMEGKTVIVTGANSGIGKETVRDLAKRGCRVIMACRNLDTAKAVQEEIIKSTGNNSIILKKLDLSSQESIRAFAADIIKTEPKLHVLVHNAGVALAIRGAKSVDGVELTMATNHYGPFLLTHLLIDLLKNTAPARIVVVASELYKLASVNLNNLNPLNTKPAAYLYYVSKYANIYFTRELARRLEGTGVTANCLHPGLVDSGIWRNVPFPLNYPVKLITRGFFKTLEQGAQTTIHLTVSDELKGVNGKYYMDCKEATLNRAAQDMEKARKLWEESAKIVKLTKDDPKI